MPEGHPADARTRAPDLQRGRERFDVQLCSAPSRASPAEPAAEPFGAGRSSESFRAEEKEPLDALSSRQDVAVDPAR